MVEISTKIGAKVGFIRKLDHLGEVSGSDRVSRIVKI